MKQYDKGMFDLTLQSFVIIIAWFFLLALKMAVAMLMFLKNSWHHPFPKKNLQLPHG